MVPYPSYSGGGGGTAGEKAAAASRSHSEAERRRRQRINGHLATLRTLLPNAARSDKASLLAQVVHRVRELRQQAATGRRTDPAEMAAALLPDEADGVTAEAEPGTALIRATFSCEDRPELLSDLDSVLRSLEVRAVKAEIATLGGRTTGVFSLLGGGDADCAAVRRALRAVLNKGAASGMPPGNKRPLLPPPFATTLLHY